VSEIPTADFERIKRLAVIAAFSDDELLDRLVLKGGNALDIVYGIRSRSSLDLDFSIEGEFENSEYLKERFERSLLKTFEPIGLLPFDVSVEERPPLLSADLANFWGGYQVSFKILPISESGLIQRGLSEMRRQALALDSRQRRSFRIDISKHEYCRDKESRIYNINAF
jgi:hypothetical protein